MSSGESVLFTPLRQLAAKVRARKVSPVALAEESLRRLDTLGRKLNAVVTLAGDDALAAAREAEAEIRRGRYRGPLHGIPYGAKDLLATKKMPTTWGAAPYRNQQFTHDATVVRKLADAGAVLVAKLSMVELAGGMGYNNADASFTGPGLNPWNTSYWSGGSSSGPGSAVAAGLVPFAIGSETVGSIITPAAFSGVTGLRPTYGLVSRHGAMALCWTLDKLGPLARGADDCAIVLDAIAGRDAADPTTLDAPRPARPPRARPRIAVVKGATEFVQPEVARNFEDSVSLLGRFADVTRDVALADLPYGMCAGTIVDAEGGSAFLDLIESGGTRELQAKSDRYGGYSSVMTPAVDYLQAMRLREKMRAPMAALLQKYDALATPSRASVSYPIGLDFDKAWPELGKDRPANFVSAIGSLIQVGNLVGWPAISLPNGFGQQGLPTGIQLLGGPFREADLVAIGREYQRRTDFHRRPPTGY
ncbi:MAG TPA: amidase [Thermoanaerobaculia bacterium]|nr:amidase [Thermoanaerobaculia bacterium]